MLGQSNLATMIVKSSIDAPSVFKEPPKCVGFYRVGSIVFGLHERPAWVHRKLAKLCLGWEWNDGYIVRRAGPMTVFGIGLKMSSD